MLTLEQFCYIIDRNEQIEMENITTNPIEVLGWALNENEDFIIEKVESSETNGHVNGTYKGNYFVLGCSNIGLGKQEHKQYSCYVFVSAGHSADKSGQQVNFKTESVEGAFEGLVDRIEKLL